MGGTTGWRRSDSVLTPGLPPVLAFLKFNASVVASGAIITLSQLDACNGITSATPEFPAGVYHYVLPEGVTSFQSSLMCYSGNITTKQVMAMKSSGICEAPRSQFAAAPMPPGTPSMSRRVLKQAA